MDCAKVMSVIVPCKNEQEVLPLFAKVLGEHLLDLRTKYGLNSEIIFIDDGSTDNTRQIIMKMRESDPSVHLIRFSRNFGKEAAMYAGLREASGDYVCIMDADLQDPPHLLEEMYLALESGEYDAAAAKRISRAGEPKLRSYFADTYYKWMSMLSDAGMDSGARDYRLMNRPYLEAVLSLCERSRFTKGIFGWVGFDVKWIPFENVERPAGNTKWSFMNLFWYAIDGLFSFSQVPARASVFPVLVFGLMLLIYLAIIFRMLLIGASFPLEIFIIGLLLLGFSVVFLCLVPICQYSMRGYTESRRRPLYIIKEKDGIPCSYGSLDREKKHHNW